MLFPGAWRIMPSSEQIVHRTSYIVKRQVLHIANRTSYSAERQASLIVKRLTITGICLAVAGLALARTYYVIPLKKSYTYQEIRHFLHTTIGTGDYYGRERIVKWTKDIRIRCYGEVEAQDVKTIKYVAHQFKRLVKGVDIAMSDEDANMKFFFIPEEQITFHLGDVHERQFEYGAICRPMDTDGVMDGAIIFIPSEQGGEFRYVLIKHEMMHCLGLMNHNQYAASYLYEGPERKQVKGFHPMDTVAIQLLYIPSVKPNMNREQTEQALSKKGIVGK